MGEGNNSQRHRKPFRRGSGGDLKTQVQERLVRKRTIAYQALVRVEVKHTAARRSSVTHQLSVITHVMAQLELL